MSELKLKTNHVPSYFNKDTLLGGLLGLTAAILVPGVPLLGALATVGGAAIGGVVGKHTQEEENKHGKTVGEPSAWNKDTAIGGMIGFIGSGLVAAAVLIAAVGATLLTAGADAPAEIIAAVGGAGLLAIGASLVATPVIGAFIGGKIGKNREAHELEEAKKQTIVEHISKTVSPEVGKAVEYSIEHNKNWGKDVTEEKLLREAQQLGL